MAYNMESLTGFVMVMENHMPYIAMLFTQFVYAGMALISKAAMDHGMNPYVFVAYRQAFATVVLAPFAFFLERKKAATLSYSLLFQIFFVSLCGTTLALNSYYVAINYTSATFATAATNTIPAVTFIMAICFRMESISMKHLHGIAKVLGFVLGVSGALVFGFVKGRTVWRPTIPNLDRPITSVFFLHQNHTLKCSDRWECVKGPLFMFLSVITWSMWLILQGPILKQYPAKLRLTALQSFFSCVQTLFWAFLMERNSSSWHLGWDFHLLSVAYCGIIVTGLTYWLQIWAIEKKGPTVTAMFSPLALIITAVFSTILWKESLYWGSVGGAMLLVGGLYSFLWGKAKEEKDENNAEREESKEVDIESQCITKQ